MAGGEAEIDTTRSGGEHFKRDKNLGARQNSQGFCYSEIGTISFIIDKSVGRI